MRHFKQGLKILLVLIGLGLAAAYAIIFNDTPGWLLLLFYLIFILVNLVTLIFPLNKLFFIADSPVWTTVGQSFSLVVTVKSRSVYWAPGLSLQLPDYSTKKTFASFYHGQPWQTVFELTAAKRGIFQKTRVTAEAVDWFGLFTKQRQFSLSPEIIVLPARDSIAEQWALEISQARQRASFGERSANIRNFREYRRGDPLKQMDWKQSARQRELIIREYEEHEETPTLLLFWGKRTSTFEQDLSRYYTLQKVFKGQAEQCLVTKTGIAPLQDDRQFALAAGFEKIPALPAFKNRQLLIFTTTQDLELKEQVRSWQRNNQVAVYDLSQMTPVLVETFAEVPDKGGQFS